MTVSLRKLGGRSVPANGEHSRSQGRPAAAGRCPKRGDRWVSIVSSGLFSQERHGLTKTRMVENRGTGAQLCRGGRVVALGTPGELAVAPLWEAVVQRL